MKKLFFAALLMVCPFTVVNATELLSESMPVDSLNPSTLKVKTIKVKYLSEKDNWEPALYLNVGFNTMVGAPSDCSFRIWPSFEVGLGFKGNWEPFGKKNVWSVGFGIDWRNYRMGNDKYWYKDATGNAQLTPFMAGQTNCKNWLNVFSLQVPVTYTHYFDKEQDWGVTLGGIVNFNTGAHATRMFEFQDEEYEVETSSLRQRPITIDALLMFSTPADLSIYCKYCPMEFFKDGAGYKMHQLSFGIWF